MTEPPTLLLTDANIFIDLAHVQALRLLPAVAKAYGCRLATTREVLNELAPEDIGAFTMDALGIELIDASQDSAATLAGLTIKSGLSPRLSETDVVLLAIAHAHGYALWTNDALLCATAAKLNIRAVRLFVPLVALTQKALLPADELLRVAEAIAAQNDRITRDVLDALRAKLEL